MGRAWCENESRQIVQQAWSIEAAKPAHRRHAGHGENKSRHLGAFGPQPSVPECKLHRLRRGREIYSRLSRPRGSLAAALESVRREGGRSARGGSVCVTTARERGADDGDAAAWPEGPTRWARTERRGAGGGAPWELCAGASGARERAVAAHLSVCDKGSTHQLANGLARPPRGGAAAAKGVESVTIAPTCCWGGNGPMRILAAHPARRGLRDAPAQPRCNGGRGHAPHPPPGQCELVHAYVRPCSPEARRFPPSHELPLNPSCWLRAGRRRRRRGS